MISKWQAVLLGLVLATGPAAADKDFAWKEPRVAGGIFTDELGMLDREREEYAGNLAGHAINEVARTKASTAALSQARRLLALSLHLMPRNRRAVVANYQLSRGMVPVPVEADYGPEVFARLLFTRAQMLQRQGGGENTLLARVFTDLAAELDPKNEDAVYASELQRLDHGSFDWERLTDVPSAAAEPPVADDDDLP